MQDYVLIKKIIKNIYHITSLMTGSRTYIQPHVYKDRKVFKKNSVCCIERHAQNVIRNKSERQFSSILTEWQSWIIKAE